MKVVLIPGPRNEELIEKVREAKMNGECIWDICESSSEVFDALYYACECGDMMLENQAKHFQNCLLNDETEYYVERMFSDLKHENCIKQLRTELEMHDTLAWRLRGMQKNTALEHHVMFAISTHTEGWDYYYVDNISGFTEDGVCDDLNANPFDVMNYLFDSFGFYPIEVQETLDWENAVAEYELKLKYENETMNN